MPRPTKAATGTSAAPVKTRSSIPPNPAARQRPAKAVAEKDSSRLIARASARNKTEVSPEQRRCYVEVAAYFIAERHGFAPGREHEDWVAAEAEIDRMLDAGLLTL